MLFKKVSETEIVCSGEIGWTYNPETDRWEDNDFANLHALLAGEFKDKNVTLSIFSGGGSAFTGNALAGAINSHGRVTGVGFGLVGSAATFMLTACKKAYLDINAELFIHEASLYTGGTKADHQLAADQLAQIDNTIAKKYVNQIALTNKLVNGSEEETMAIINEMMRKESFVNALACFEMGLIDGYFDANNKLIKQPKGKPDTMGSPASDNVQNYAPLDFAGIPEKTRAQISNSIAQMVGTLDKNLGAQKAQHIQPLFSNFLGVKSQVQTPANMQTNPLEVAPAATPTPPVEPTNAVETQAEKSLMIQTFDFIKAMLGLSPQKAVPAIETPQNVAPVAPAEVAPVAPQAQPQNVAPAQPAQPVAPAIIEVENQAPRPPLSTVEAQNAAAQNSPATNKTFKLEDINSLPIADRKGALLAFMNQSLQNPINEFGQNGVDAVVSPIKEVMNKARR
jgi:ATP-dependent protease ClpP protease subunit